jgi:hypothetical protein
MRMADSIDAISIILLAISVFGIMGCGVVIGNLVFVRFYNNFFTDEGYLTFTLPVGRGDLLLSKTLNAGICLFTYILLAVVCVLAVFTLGGFDFNVYEEIGDFLRQSYARIGAMLIVYIAEGILLLFSGLFLVISVIQFAITLGSSIAKKARVIASIGVFYAVSVATYLIMPRFGYYVLEGHSTIATVLLMYSVVSITVGLALYFVTLDRITRKLNLD